jgi:hypothetical protein
MNRFFPRSLLSRQETSAVLYRVQARHTRQRLGQDWAETTSPQSNRETKHKYLIPLQLTFSTRELGRFSLLAHGITV